MQLQNNEQSPSIRLSYHFFQPLPLSRGVSYQDSPIHGISHFIRRDVVSVYMVRRFAIPFDQNLIFIVAHPKRRGAARLPAGGCHRSLDGTSQSPLRGRLFRSRLPRRGSTQCPRFREWFGALFWCYGGARGKGVMVADILWRICSIS